MAKALDIANVCKQYGKPTNKTSAIGATGTPANQTNPNPSVQALSNVSLSIEEGEFFGLLGPNGAGKTTLIGILGGLVQASSGQVRVMGCDVVSDFRQARRLLGIVPQELVFDPFFTVRETLQFQSGYFGLSKNNAWIDELLHSLGLANKANTNMRRLSGGMKRRVMVAQALVHKPPVIVLDEPTAGVDVELRQALWQFVQTLNQQGHTIVLTTHYLEEAQTLCKRIAMLQAGRVVAVDTTHNLLRQYAHQTLSLRLSGTLPAALANKILRQEPNEHHYCLQLLELCELETILATVRQAGLTLHECRLDQADLEDVFVQTMARAKA
jgi:ABC-2 type transport system ATP-binding protein